MFYCVVRHVGTEISPTQEFIKVNIYYCVLPISLKLSNNDLFIIRTLYLTLCISWKIFCWHCSMP